MVVVKGPVWHPDCNYLYVNKTIKESLSNSKCCQKTVIIVSFIRRPSQIWTYNRKRKEQIEYPPDCAVTRCATNLAESVLCSLLKVIRDVSKITDTVDHFFK